MARYDATSSRWDGRADTLAARCELALTDNAGRAGSAAIYAQVYDSFGLAGLTTPLDSTLSAREARLVAQIATTAPVQYKNTLRTLADTYVNRFAGLDSDGAVWTSTQGDYNQRLRAAELTRLTEAVFADRHGRWPDVSGLQRHAIRLAVTSTGSAAVFCHYDRDKGGPEFELDDTLSVGIDRRGGPHSAAQALVRTVWLSPEEVYARFGRRVDSAQDLVRVFQGWLLSRGDRPGRCVAVTTDGIVLQNQPYESSELPCALFHASEPMLLTPREGPAVSGRPQGVWGLPLAHHLRSLLSVENETIAEWVQTFRDLAAAYLILDPSQVENADSLRGQKRIHVIEMRPGAGTLGAAPQVVLPPRNDQNALAFIAQLNEMGREQTGLNQALIQGSREIGTRSGTHEAYAASRVTERHAASERDIRAFRTVEHARILAECLRCCSDKLTRPYYTAKGATRAIDLCQLDLSGRDKFVLRPAPVQEEVSTPRARLEKARTDLELGVLDAATYVDLQKHLDVLSAERVSDVLTEGLQTQIQTWLTHPDPTLDLVQPPLLYVGDKALRSLIRQCSEAHARAMLDGTPQERLDLFESYLEYAVAAIGEFRQSPLAPPAAPAGAPAPQDLVSAQSVG